MCPVPSSFSKEETPSRKGSGSIAITRQGLTASNGAEGRWYMKKP